MAVGAPGRKKLGLELRHENLVAGDIRQTPNEPAPKRQKLTFNSHDKTQDVKISADSLSVTTKDLVLDKSKVHESVAAQVKDQPPTRNKKSVSFDPSISYQDGDSPVAYEKRSPVMNNGHNKRGAQKRPKSRTKSTAVNATGSNTNSTSQDGTATKPYLEYLTKFDLDKKHWKFNKNLQTQLLVNLFNPHRIPPSYDSALLRYISGLKGQDARRRLLEEANKIISVAKRETKSPETNQNGSAASEPKDGSEQPSEEAITDGNVLPDSSASANKFKKKKAASEPLATLADEKLKKEMETRAKSVVNILDPDADSDSDTDTDTDTSTASSTPTSTLSPSPSSSPPSQQESGAPEQSPDRATLRLKKRSRGRKRRLGANASTNAEEDSAQKDTNVTATSTFARNTNESG